jgi:hypothetical protein
MTIIYEGPNEVEAVQVEPIPESSLQYLQSIYKNTSLSVSIRLRAALGAIAYESPKLSVSLAVGDASNYAEALERAVEHERRYFGLPRFKRPVRL